MIPINRWTLEHLKEYFAALSQLYGSYTHTYNNCVGRKGRSIIIPLFYQICLCIRAHYTDSLEWSHPQVRLQHWRTCEVNCLWRGNKYSRGEQGINMRIQMTHAHQSGYIPMVSEHSLIRKQHVFSMKIKSPAVSLDNLEEAPWVTNPKVVGDRSCYSLSTFTVDSDVNWMFTGMMYAMVKQRPDSSPAGGGDKSA